MPDSYEYDRADFLPPKRKRKKRVSAITGKETGLQPETELQIQFAQHYRDLIQVDGGYRHLTKLYAVGAAVGNLKPYIRDLQKRMGKIKGVFDLHFMDKRRKPFRYVWIEAKVGKNGYTKEQKEFADWLSDTPIQTRQAFNLNQFIDILEGR